jgi:phosphoglycerate dehydrogenase-like enzyme
VERVFRTQELPEFLGRLDFLVIVLPLTPATRHRFGLDEFRLMKPTAWVMNVSRGAIIAEEGLVSALEQGLIGGAVLDVFETEPLPQTSPLWGLPNAIVTPHYAGPSLPPQIVDFFVANLARYRRGRRLSGLVDLKRGF